MNRLSLRNNRLKFKTSDKLPICLEECIKYTGTCNLLDSETLGSWLIMPKNLPGHCLEWLHVDQFRVFKVNFSVKSTKKFNFQVAYCFKGFMLDEWEVCLYTKNSPSPTYPLNFLNYHSVVIKRGWSNKSKSHPKLSNWLAIRLKTIKICIIVAWAYGLFDTRYIHPEGQRICGG